MNNNNLTPEHGDVLKKLVGWIIDVIVNKTQGKKE